MSSRYLTFVVAVGIVAASVPTHAADQELYFSKSSAYAPLGTTPLVFGNNDVIDVELVPNVRFEVLEVLDGGTTRPALYRVSTRGDGGVDVARLTADVSFQLGRFHTTYWLIDRLWYVGALMFAHHAEGTYRIRAFYREFVTPPMLIVVR